MSPGTKGSAVWSNQEIKAGAEEGAKPGGREASGLDWFTFLGRHNLCSVQALCWALEAPRIQLRICLWEVKTPCAYTWSLHQGYNKDEAAGCGSTGHKGSMPGKTWGRLQRYGDKYIRF